jgi:hypothetical protein
VTPEEFVEAIRLVVLDGARRSTISTLEAPPGRKPRTELLERSDWYHSLAETDKVMVQAVIRDAAHAATFGFLCVLDGVSAIEPSGPKGELQLIYRAPDGGDVTLNGEGHEDLHDILNAIAYPS